MSRAFVRFRAPDGALHDLTHGDVIGRLWSVALPIPDPRVSEMHAMVSLRGSALRLLGLRGRFAIDLTPVADAALAPGQSILLADGVALEVVAVELPDEVMALEGDGLPRQALPNVASLRVGARVELVPGHVPDAAATIWSDGLDWRVRVGADEHGLSFGDAFSAGGRTFSAVALGLGASSATATLPDGAVRVPLHLRVCYDTVHVHRGDDPPVALDGLSARIVSELAVISQPIGWEALAREIWRSDDTPAQLRRRWDVALARLRRRLRDARIRPDLVRADGTGNV
ncbi:MAG: hypothetical protein KC635_03855, partial [Myxococcales bacterium]|nr:hypothetical protein [Myxococcales bacterium]